MPELPRLRWNPDRNLDWRDAWSAIDEAGGVIVEGFIDDPLLKRLQAEFHDCIEEIYCVSGDIWLGNSGTMGPGSYLWRPPYITHGPFRSESGCVLFLFVDETLINHFVDDPRSSQEKNRRRVETEAG